MSEPKPLAVVGNVNVDLIMGPVAPWPDPGTEIIVPQTDLRLGGAAGNVALAWQALGRDFQIASNTGQGPFGVLLRQAFAPRSDRWPVAASGTTISVGLTHPDSERTFFTSQGHLADLSWPEVQAMIDWPGLVGGMLLVCGSFVCDALVSDYDALFATARAQGIRIALDTGWPPDGWTPHRLGQVKGWLAQCDCLLLNEAETRALCDGCTPDSAPDALLPIMPPGAQVVVKCGPSGAVARAAGGPLVRTLAPAVVVQDTIGAGDIFNAGFLAAWAEGAPLSACLHRGVASASTAISTLPRRYGGEPSPTESPRG